MEIGGVVLGAVLAVIGAVGVWWFTEGKQKRKDEDKAEKRKAILDDLARMKVEGVVLRNRARGHLQPEDFKDWLLDVQKWYPALYNKAEELGYYARSQVETLNEYKLRRDFDEIGTIEQLKAVSELSETLERLQDLLRDQGRTLAND